MPLASFFSRPPHKNLGNVAKAVASAVRAAGKVQQAEAAEAAEAVPKNEAATQHRHRASQEAENGTQQRPFNREVQGYCRHIEASERC